MKAVLRSWWVARDGAPEAMITRFEVIGSVEFDVPDGETVVAAERSAAGWMITTIRNVGEE